MEDWLKEFDWNALMINFGLIILKLAIILIVFIIAKAFGKKIINKSFDRIEQQKNMSPGRSRTLRALVNSVFFYTIIFILTVIIFELFNFDVKGLIAGAGILGLAIGFGAQGLVSDVVTGFFLLLERQLDVGDYVTTAGFGGIVEDVGLRTTQIRGFDGTLHFIPNRQINTLSNHSRGNMRALVDIGISYDDDMDKAIEVIQQACDDFAKSNDKIVEGPNVLGVQAFGASDVVIRVIAKTHNMEQWAVERQLRKAIKEAFDKNGIEIPFPHQVLIEKKATN